jgi:hypothetical protein
VRLEFNINQSTFLRFSKSQKVNTFVKSIFFPVNKDAVHNFIIEIEVTVVVELGALADQVMVDSLGLVANQETLGVRTFLQRHQTLVIVSRLVARLQLDFARFF